jgi:phosphoribosylaminoimidazole carboxylase PurE protein
VTKALVSIVMGSDSDLEIMREAAQALNSLGIAYEIDITSAHRSPDRTAQFARQAAERGIRVIIAGAGGAAHLAGVIAAHTTLPVIGVPIPSTSLNGLDSLLSTVQMPAGIPVAAVAIGKAGAANAGILAAQILGLADEAIAKALDAHKQKLAQGVEEKSAKLRAARF